MNTYVGKIMFLILNLPLIGIWVRLLIVPYGYLLPLILLSCLIGLTYQQQCDGRVYHAGLQSRGIPDAEIQLRMPPMILALVLGPMFEQSFIQSPNGSAGSDHIFFERPASAVTLILALVLTFLSALPSRRRKTGDLHD
jgi:putative tricarboxylic transport membrane protein